MPSQMKSKLGTSSSKMQTIISDGGREASGYAVTSDCVPRAISHYLNDPALYSEIYDELSYRQVRKINGYGTDSRVWIGFLIDLGLTFYKARNRGKAIKTENLPKRKCIVAVRDHAFYLDNREHETIYDSHVISHRRLMRYVLFSNPTMEDRNRLAPWAYDATGLFKQKYYYHLKG